MPGGMPAEVWTCPMCHAPHAGPLEYSATEVSSLCPACRRTRGGADRATSPAYRISQFMLERQRS